MINIVTFVFFLRSGFEPQILYILWIIFINWVKFTMTNSCCPLMKHTTIRLRLFTDNFFNYFTLFVWHNSIDNIELVRLNIFQLFGFKSEIFSLWVRVFKWCLSLFLIIKAYYYFHLPNMQLILTVLTKYFNFFFINNILTIFKSRNYE